MRNHFSPTVICGFIHPHLQTSFLSSKNYYVSSKYQFITIHVLYGTPFTYVTRHEKIGLICTQNLTTFLDFELK